MPVKGATSPLRGLTHATYRLSKGFPPDKRMAPLYPSEVAREGVVYRCEADIRADLAQQLTATLRRWEKRLKG